MHELDVLVGKIQSRFGEHPKLGQALDECAYFSRKRPAQAARGSARGRRRRRVDQVGDTLGLRQVDLAVEECPLGEFAGLRKAGSELEATAQNLREHRGAAVAV